MKILGRAVIMLEERAERNSVQKRDIDIQERISGVFWRSSDIQSFCNSI